MKPRKSPTARLPVREQVSAGGVVFRRYNERIEVVIVGVGPQNRWQLPKGLVEPNEQPETAAVREAREEAGVTSEIVSHIETVEYWFAGLDGGEKVRHLLFVNIKLAVARHAEKPPALNGRAGKKIAQMLANQVPKKNVIPPPILARHLHEPW